MWFDLVLLCSELLSLEGKTANTQAAIQVRIAPQLDPETAAPTTQNKFICRLYDFAAVEAAGIKEGSLFALHSVCT